MQSTHTGRKHFAVLDGLRGIAAIGIVIYHSYYDHGGFLPNGSSAVDLFFILSGFVVGMAYDDDLRSTMSAREFMLRRVIRLFPMIFVASALSVAIAIGQHFTNPTIAYPLDQLAVPALLSFLCIPYFGNSFGHGIFPFDPVLWSLFFELWVANLAYALGARWLTAANVTALVVICLFFVAIGPGVGGSNAALFWWGVVRVACGFFDGLLLSWAFKSGKLQKIPGSVWLATAILIGIMAIPFQVGTRLYIPQFLVLAAIIPLAVNAKVSKPIERLCNVLGQVSYPLYTIHWLTLAVFKFADKKVGIGYDAMVLLHVIFAFALSYGLAIWFEKPVCGWLNRRFLPQRKRGPVEALATAHSTRAMG